MRTEFWQGRGELLAIVAAVARLELVPFELVSRHEPGLERLPGFDKPFGSEPCFGEPSFPLLSL